MDTQRDGPHWFQYGPEAVAYLKQKDKILGALIDQIGSVRREVDPDLFSAVVHHIVGQQISTKAQATIWGRMREALIPLDAASVLAAGMPRLQSFGLTFRKADYITDFAAKVQSGAFDPEQIRHSSDQEAVEALCGLKGVGVWTAEMILLFCLQRPDVLSYDDLAIQRGLRMVYRHRSIDRARFERYRRRWSPYGSTASLYLWAAAGGAVPGLTDPALKAKRSMPKKGKKEGLS